MLGRDPVRKTFLTFPVSDPLSLTTDPPVKENPYEDVELHGRCLGKKCVLNFPGSPTSSIPDTPTKVWVPAGGSGGWGGAPQRCGLVQPGVLGYTGMPGHPHCQAPGFVHQLPACSSCLWFSRNPSAQQSFLKYHFSFWVRTLPD